MFKTLFTASALTFATVFASALPVDAAAAMPSTPAAVTLAAPSPLLSLIHI